MFAEERLITEKIVISENNSITKSFISTLREHIALIVKNVVSQNGSFVDLSCNMTMRYKDEEGNKEVHQVTLNTDSSLEQWNDFILDIIYCEKMDLLAEYRYFDYGHFDNNGPFELMREYYSLSEEDLALSDFITMIIAESSSHEHLKRHYFGKINGEKHFGEVSYVKADAIPEGPWYCDDIVVDLLGFSIENYLCDLPDEKECNELIDEFFNAEEVIHHYCYTSGEVVGDADESGYYYSGLLLNSPQEKSIKTEDLDDFAKNLAIINKYFENHNPQTLYFGNVESKNLKQMAIKFYADGHYTILVPEM